jgi:CheY-like chemotaxis protein
MLPARVPTILVIDDMEIVRRSAARCLRYRGYFVLEASSGDDALQLIANCPELDLVLTDLVLPAKGGTEIVAEIRRRFPNVAVAFMTGHIGMSARYEIAPEAGIPVLIKPFTPALLDRRVREALAASGWPEPFGSPSSSEPARRQRVD